MSDAAGTQGDGTPKKGGFGAFSEKYRDRWATGHPNSKRQGGDATASPAPDAPGDPSAPPADDPPPAQEPKA